MATIIIWFFWIVPAPFGCCDNPEHWGNIYRAPSVMPPVAVQVILIIIIIIPGQSFIRGRAVCRSSLWSFESKYVSARFSTNSGQAANPIFQSANPYSFDLY